MKTCQVELHKKGFPVEFFTETEDKGKTVDILTKIEGRDSYLEVKRISKRDSAEENIIGELKKLEIPFTLGIYVTKLGHPAAKVARKIQETIAEKKISSFPMEIEFDYGHITVYGRGKAGRYILSWDDVIPPRKEDFELGITGKMLEKKVEDILEEKTLQLKSHAREKDLCLILIDNYDVGFMDDRYVYGKLYGGVTIYHAPGTPPPRINLPHKVYKAIELGWKDFLVELGFVPSKHYVDYTEKKHIGWTLYSENSENLNGVFYLSGGVFEYSEECVYLNPFVKESRNVSSLQRIFEYHKGS